MMAMAVIDLPHPDSPTRPMVSPARTVKLTLSTIFTSPWELGNWMEKLRTSMRLSSAPSNTRRRSLFFSASASADRDSLSDAAASSALVWPRVLASVTTSLSGFDAAEGFTAGAARASVSPSARMFNASTVSRIIRPGKNVGHHAPVSRSCLPSARMLPHEGFGGFTPALMKDREASKTTASATRTVANTAIGAMQLRATCLSRMCAVEAPSTREAET